MLLTHPLPDSRLSDARNRANQMPKHIVQSSQDYLMAKVRALGMYSSEGYGLNEELLGSLSKGNVREQAAAKYGRAILFYEAKIRRCAQHHSTDAGAGCENVWLIDLMTDIDLGQNARHRPSPACRRQRRPEQQPGAAAQPGQCLCRRQPAGAGLEDPEPLYLCPSGRSERLGSAGAGQRRPGLRDEELSARAESLALTGRLDQAIGLLSNASSLQKLGSLKQARYDARIDQLRQLQQRFRQYQRS